MVELFTGYKRFPYRVPLKVKLTNIIRYFFKLPILENLLISNLMSAKNPHWRKLIPPLYFYKPGSIKTVKRGEINYQLDLSMLLDHEVFFYQMNEDPAFKFLFKQLRSDFIVLDVGANIGYLTLNFARACPQGFVYSFEPDSQNFESLKKNVQLNKYKNIKIFKNGLGSKKEKAILYKCFPWNPGANRILSKAPGQKHEGECIDIVPLDQIAEDEKIPKVDLLKIDVEGFEMFVILGARKLIERWKPILFIEVATANLKQQNYTARNLIEAIEDLGYLVLDARTGQPIDKTFPDHHTDALCFPSQNTTLSAYE